MKNKDNENKCTCSQFHLNALEAWAHTHLLIKSIFRFINKKSKKTHTHMYHIYNKLYGLISSFKHLGLDKRLLNFKY